MSLVKIGPKLASLDELHDNEHFCFCVNIFIKLDNVLVVELIKDGCFLKKIFKACFSKVFLGDDLWEEG